MSDLSEFSIFGGKFDKKAEKPSHGSQVPGAPNSQTPSALPVQPAAEIIDIEHLTAEQLDALFPSENSEKHQAKPANTAPAVSAAPKSVAAPSPIASAPATPLVSEPAKPQAERRAKRRALISAPVRVRSIDLTHDGLDDVTTTMNVSRIGILFASANPAYYRSMDVMVTFPHSKAPTAIQAEQPGRVVRVSQLPDGRRSIAIALGVTHHDEEFIHASGEKVHTEQHESAKFAFERDPNSMKPLVLALDAEKTIRESLQSYLANEGYDVITVTNAQEARDVLSQCTPSLLIAEIEGEGMPGYDLCAHCKSTPRLQSVPVMLTTSSAYPSDYASAHSLGAVVCMAKPYRQERLGHVVKLLAPPPNANDEATPPRPADPSRRHLGASSTTKSPSSTPNNRFRFGRKS